MKIDRITYQRVVNLGNYESKRLEASAILENNDNPEKKAQELIAYVEDLVIQSKSTVVVNDIEF